jgi:hypothetical protein
MRRHQVMRRAIEGVSLRKKDRVVKSGITKAKSGITTA